LKIEGYAAVVTGGASGLGLATVQALADAGAKVAIFDRNEIDGEKVAKSVGGIFCRVDVTDSASIEAGFAKAREAHAQERILVNCAGTGEAIKSVSRNRKTGEIRRYPIETFTRTVDINLLGTFRCITASVAGMLTLEALEGGERGVVTNTASVAAEDGQTGQAAYAASKGGIVAMTLPIARDLSSEGVRINTILPGLFATPPMLSVPPELFESLSKSVPFPSRLGEPKEYASLVLELCRNTYFNGASIRLDAAIRLAPR
jgi:NAD(P)-dependent dehydrogenase (short-subunit alcohol dehydrogenase family)